MKFFVENCGRYIPLTQGQKTLVDVGMYDELVKVKWNARKSTNGKKFYAYRLDNISMARVVNRTPQGMCVDHINHNTLDNRKSNLRSVTQHQNSMNKGRQKNKSGFLGVYFNKNQARLGARPWQATVRKNYKFVNVGYFRTPEEAAHARDSKAKELFGQFAVLNFPEDQQ